MQALSGIQRRIKKGGTRTSPPRHRNICAESRLANLQNTKDTDAAENEETIEPHREASQIFDRH